MTGARYRQVADELRDRIVRGDVDPSGQLASEARLGAEFAVSRVTVRKALELLRERGLVESRRGAGWFVAGGSFRQRLALGSFRHAASAVEESGHRLARHVVSFGSGRQSWGFADLRGRRVYLVKPARSASDSVRNQTSGLVRP